MRQRQARMTESQQAFAGTAEQAAGQRTTHGMAIAVKIDALGFSPDIRQNPRQFSQDLRAPGPMSGIAQQATRAARRAIADAVLFNEGLSLTQLDALVEVLWAGWAGDRVKQ